MDIQKEYNKILDSILLFEDKATQEEKKKVFNALRDYLKRRLN